MNDIQSDQTKAPRKDQLLGQRAIWQKGLKILGETRRQTMAIALVGLILPQLAIQAFFDTSAVDVGLKIRDLVVSMQSGGVSFTDLMATSAVYFSSYMFVNLLYLLIFLSSYLALVFVCINALRGDPEISTGRALAHGLKATIPRGLLVVMIFALIFTLGQLLIFPLIIVTSLGLMIPVILLTENKSAVRTLWDAVTLKYSRQTPYSGWNIMFALLTLAAIFYTGILGVSLLQDLFLHLDEAFGMPRTLWTLTVADSPFPLFYVLASLASKVATAAVVCLIPALTTAAYFEVVKPRAIAQA